MESASPLRDAFTELLTDEAARHAFAADPDGYMAAYGHGDLPGSLLAEAIANYADTTPPEVAEHLSPFVMDHWAQAEGAAAHAGLELLATAPAGETDVPADFDADFNADLNIAEVDVAATRSDQAPELDFGTGAEAWDQPIASDDVPELVEEASFQAEFPQPLPDLPPVEPGIQNVNVGEGEVQADPDTGDGDID